MATRAESVGAVSVSNHRRTVVTFVGIAQDPHAGGDIAHLETGCLADPK